MPPFSRKWLGCRANCGHGWTPVYILDAVHGAGSLAGEGSVRCWIIPPRHVQDMPNQAKEEDVDCCLWPTEGPGDVTSKDVTYRRNNKQPGNYCRVGKDCKFQHNCSICGGPHTATRCKTRDRLQRETERNSWGTHRKCGRNPMEQDLSFAEPTTVIIITIVDIF